MEEKRKRFEGNNWEAMYRKGKLKKYESCCTGNVHSKRTLKHSKGALKREKVDVITSDIARLLVPDSLQVPDDSDSDDDDDDDSDDVGVVVQEIGSDVDDSGDFDEEYDKTEDEGEAVVEEKEEEKEEESITTLLHTTRCGRICRTWKGRASALGFSWRSGKFQIFYLITSHQMVKKIALQK